MARAHAHIITAIWSDPDWTALDANAQRTYLLLLSQPKLSLVGLLDMLPSRWARLAGDTTPGTIRQALDDLEHAGFVLVDHNTDELVIRTFVRHEATPAKVANPRWLAGLWSAWSSVESRMLRDAIAAEIPDAVWESDKTRPPTEAQTTRSAQKLPTERSGRTFRQDVPQDVDGLDDTPQDATPVDNSTPDGDDPPPDEPQTPRSGQKLPAETSTERPPVSSIQSPVTNPLSSSDYSHNAPDPPDDDDPDQQQPDTSPDPDARVDAALEILANRDLEARKTAVGDVGDEWSWISTAIKRRRARHGPGLATAAASNPGATPTELADLIEPPAGHDPPSSRNGTTPSPHDETLSAQMARAEANTRQLKAERVDVETTGHGPAAARQALRTPPDDRSNP